jgi:hypothetical protein
MILYIYYAHFQAHLQYGIIFWGYDSDSIKIFRLQKKVIGLICGIGRLVSCSSVFRDYKILTVPSLYILETLYFIKKHSTHLKSNEQPYDYNTRGKTNYHKLSHNASQYQKSVTNMGVKLYNCLPNRLNTLTSVNIFKYEVKRILLENAFYTVHEFYNWKVLAIWFYFMRKSSLVCCFVLVVVFMYLSCRIHFCTFVCVNWLILISLCDFMLLLGILVLVCLSCKMHF